MARVLKPGRGFYIWGRYAMGGYANCANYPPVLKAVGLYFSQAIIWDKEHPVLTRKDRRGTRVERVGFAWQRGRWWDGNGPRFSRRERAQASEAVG
jgi:DNA modification methylase